MEYEVTQLCKLLFLYVGFFSLFFPGFWMVKWYVWTLWIMGFFVYFLSGKIMLSEKIWFGHFFLFIYLFIYFVSFFCGGFQVSQLADSKSRRSCVCSIFPTASVLCLMFFIGSVLIGQDYSEVFIYIYIS